MPPNYATHLLHVPATAAQRASTSSTSSAATSSTSFSDFERLSKGGSDFTDRTLVTPLDSVDSILGDDPDLEPTEPSWTGLSDDQWSREQRRGRSLVAKARYAVKEAHEAILHDLEKAFDGLGGDPRLKAAAYATPDEEFDPVDAVRRRLLREDQTAKSRRALEIIYQRSKPRTGPLGDRCEVETDMERAAIEGEDGIEDYSGDFELGQQKMLEIPSTPETNVEITPRDVEEGKVKDSANVHAWESIGSSASDNVLVTTPGALDHDVVLSPFQCTINFPMPPKPVILPADTEWADCPSFTSDSTSVDSISQMLISPLQLNHPVFSSSPAIMSRLVEDGYNPSSTSSISSFFFSSRHPLPTSRPDETMDTAAVMQLEVAVSLQTITARDTLTQEDILGALGQPQNAQATEFPPASGASLCSPSDRPTSSASFLPPSSSGGKLPISSSEGDIIQIAPEPIIEPSSVLLGANDIHPSNESIPQTVTAGSDHPAAARSFMSGQANASWCDNFQRGERQTLGLGLPSTFAGASRAYPTMSTSEECADLAALATAGASRGDLSTFGRQLSAILEVLETPPPSLELLVVHQPYEPELEAPSNDEEIEATESKNPRWERFKRWFRRRIPKVSRPHQV